MSLEQQRNKKINSAQRESPNSRLGSPFDLCQDKLHSIQSGNYFCCNEALLIDNTIRGGHLQMILQLSLRNRPRVEPFESKRTA